MAQAEAIAGVQAQCSVAGERVGGGGDSHPSPAGVPPVCQRHR